MTTRTAKVGAACLGFVAASAFVAGIAADHYVLRMLTKPWPVLLMAITVFAAARQGNAGRQGYAARQGYGRLVGTGLLACLAGDLLLEASAATFLAGVGAFFVGHVLYIAAYLGRSREWRPLLALPFAAWGVAVVAILRPGLEAAGLLVPVALYSAAIMVMVWRAAACWETGGPSDVTVLALAGALLFAVSDTMIAVDRFQQPFAGVRYAIILLYWSGQLGITLSALRFRGEYA